MVATTLTVVSCLHRHASLDSMREVETVQPLVFVASSIPAISAGQPMVRRYQRAATQLTSRSDHEVQPLDDLRRDTLVAAEFYVLRAYRTHRAAAGEPAELQRVH